MFTCRFGILISTFSGLLLAAGGPPAMDQLARLPLSFEPNLGQTDSRVRFVARSAGYTLFLGSSEAVMLLTSVSGNEGASLRMTLDGAATPAASVALDRQPGVSAYFIGKDSSRWLPEVPHYARVLYQAVYPGIDLLYYGNGRQVEYDFVVAPGADTGRIRLSYQGAERMTIDPSSGDLILTTRLGDLHQRKPRVYQQAGGRQVEVLTTYRLNGRQVSFDVARYDHAQPLVIDPVFIYSSYLGGNTRISSMAMDSAGAVYVTGLTVSISFPVANPIQPGRQPQNRLLSTAFVTKLNPYPGTGPLTLAYSTYLGGGNYDEARGIAVDPGGAAYISGTTNSPDFPILNAYQSTLPSGPSGLTSGFITKLNPYGGSGNVSLAYSTYLGGSYQQFEGIAVDSTGAAYVVGACLAADFPSAGALRPFQDGDAFVARLNPYNGTGNVTLGYSTPLAGGRATAVAVDSTGAAYVAGYTFPPGTVIIANAFQATPPGGFDGFVAKLNPFNGGLVSLAYSTYLGGSGTDYAYAIAIDSTGAAYVAGTTTSTDFPALNAWQTHNAGNGDAFVTRLNPYTGTGPVTMAFSTYLGGAANEVAAGIALDSAGAIYVAGASESANFPILDPTPGAFTSGAFITKFNAPKAGPLTLAYSTQFGTSAGGLIAIDPAGAMQMAGSTSSASFPLRNAFQSDYIDIVTDALIDSDGYVAKLPQPGAVIKTPVNVTVTSPTVSSLRSGQSIVTGQGMTFTATFSGAAGSSITGVVWFVGSYQGSVLCSAPIVNGVANCEAPASSEISVGSNTVTVGYPGDSTYTLGAVTSITFSVVKAVTSTTLSISPSPPPPGAATLTATVAIAPPGGVTRSNGVVTFTKDGTLITGCAAVHLAPPSCLFGICNAPVTQFSFTCPISVSFENAAFGASYSGDDWTTPSTAAPLPIINVKANPTFAVFSNPPVAVYGQPVTITVSAQTGPFGLLPTGTVTITDSANPGSLLATVVLNASGSGSITVPSTGAAPFSVGSHTIGIAYSGDSNFTASSATGRTLVVVSKASTVTSLIAQQGTTVTLTASVSVIYPGAGAPTGSVQFSNGSALIGTAPLVAAGDQFIPVLNAGAIAGNITATYTGDSSFNTSPSPVLTLTNPPPPAFIALSIVPNSDPAPVGQPVIITVSTLAPGEHGSRPPVPS